MDDKGFWLKLEQLVALSRVRIDRPRGTAHPRYANFHYPYDYGHLQGTESSDEHEVDVWIGSRSARNVTGVVFTVDVEKRDLEAKVLLACTSEEARRIAEIHNEGSQGAMLIERHLRRGTA